MSTPVRPASSRSAAELPGPLRRSRADRVVAGVCGGLGSYLGINPAILRLALVALTLAGGAGVVLYVVAAIVIPEAEATEQADAPVPETWRDHRVRVLAGGILVVLGVVALLDEVWPTLDAYFWPVVLIAIGAGLAVRTRGP